jgi:FkbM family methyltransferase
VSAAYDHLIELTAEGWWVLKDDTHLSRWVEQAHRLDHDQPVLQKLAPYIEPGTTVLDVGAALGDHTVFYLDKVGPDGCVVAFEPHPFQFECLRRNCPKAICYPNAVGETEGNVWLFHQPDVVAGSRLIDPALQWPMSQVGRISIDRLSALQVHGARISFMKIDVEGCEPEVLRGAQETINRHRPMIWMEVNPIALERQHHTIDELRALVDELGYSVKEFYPPGADWSGYQDGQCDILCIPVATS